jgi:hypothetical protein
MFEKNVNIPMKKSPENSPNLVTLPRSKTAYANHPSKRIQSQHAKCGSPAKTGWAGVGGGLLSSGRNWQTLATPLHLNQRRNSSEKAM